MRTPILFLAALPLLACSGQATGSPPATPPATAPPSSSPSPATPALAVLVDYASNGYDVALVGTDGHVVAHAHAATRSLITAGGSGSPGALAVDPPEVSAANGRVYYLDGDQFVRYLTPDGSTGTVAELPGTSTAHVGFAVSDDGKQVAASVLTFQGSTETTTLFVDEVGGANHHELLHDSNEVVWPVAWHDGQLVLAVGSAPFVQQRLTLNPSFATRYELVDPTTGKTSGTIGGPDPATGCVVTGLLVPAGTACLHGAGSASEVWPLSWSGAHPGAVGTGKLQVAGAALHPTQGSVAICCDAAGVVDVAKGVGATPAATTLKGAGDSSPCWIDDTHVLVGSVNDHQFTPGILDTGSGQVTPVSGARGFCAAVLGAGGASGEPDV